MTDDLYTVCPDCGEKKLLDSGVLGMNCFSDPCKEKCRALVQKLLSAWRKREIKRLQDLL